MSFLSSAGTFTQQIPALPPPHDVKLKKNVPFNVVRYWNRKLRLPVPGELISVQGETQQYIFTAQAEVLQCSKGKNGLGMGD